MARSRNLKPAFFTNEILAACSPLARLLFAGLWTIADAKGRLEDRPARIKASVLPYDDTDPEKLLAQLSENGFIIRYQVDGQRLIQITNFEKHQRPHYKEVCVYPGYEPEKTLAQPEKVQAEPEKNLASLLLNPLTSSLTPHPSSLNPEPEEIENKNASLGPVGDQTWPGWLVREWDFHYSGTAKTERDPSSLNRFFKSLIESGIPPERIRDGIRAPPTERPRTQPTWEFEKYLRGGKHGQREGVGGSSRVRAPAGKYAGLGQTIQLSDPSTFTKTAAETPPPTPKDGCQD